MIKTRVSKLIFGMIGVLALLICSGALYLQHPKFGELPEGRRVAVLEQSPNYRSGQFHNLVETPMFAGDKTFLEVLVENLRSEAKRLTPNEVIPSTKMDFKTVDPGKDLVVWLGHSSYFVQVNGQRLLIDPVFSQYAAPVPFLNGAYEGTYDYSVEDFPEIDALLITHDHWDHLDYSSVRALRQKVEQVVTPLGVGSYFRGWGYPDRNVLEGDWNDSFELDGNIRVHLVPARHYSGRLLTRRKTLWAGFVIETPKRRLFFSGDSGYGAHFSALGERFGHFHLVSLDSGQYDPRWPYIHMNPEEAVTAALDLNAGAVMQAHVGKFTLARHAWDEPFERMLTASRAKPFSLLTPRIGSPVNLDDAKSEQFSNWWE